MPEAIGLPPLDGGNYLREDHHEDRPERGEFVDVIAEEREQQGPSGHGIPPQLISLIESSTYHLVVFVFPRVSPIRRIAPETE